MNGEIMTDAERKKLNAKVMADEVFEQISRIDSKRAFIAEKCARYIGEPGFLQRLRALGVEARAFEEAKKGGAKRLIGNGPRQEDVHVIPARTAEEVGRSFVEMSDENTLGKQTDHN